MTVIPHQPPHETAFAFHKENLKKAESILVKYPSDRKASATLPLLELAQRQNSGWLSRSALDYVAAFLGLAPVRVYEVASFYTMFNLKPVGEHLVQVCTTTPCWLRGSDKIVKACKKHLGIDFKETTKDQKFTLVEVECLGACVNAPMVQINDDYYEDLNEKSMIHILEQLAEGQNPKTGSYLGRHGSEPSEKTLDLMEDKHASS
jgi:NADH-quinone oxidoreductase E subunit